MVPSPRHENKDPSRTFDHIHYSAFSSLTQPITMETSASSPSFSSHSPSKRQKSAEDEEKSSEKSEAVENGLKVFFDQNQLALQKNLEEREAAMTLAEQQLKEANEAAPALFAKPGDQFTFHVKYCDFDAIFQYVGRNKTTRQRADFGGDHNYQSPEIGWLIFRNVGDVKINVYRDIVGAWPIAAYSHYEGGEMIQDTLCIPPSMCGELNVWKGWGEEDD